MFWDFVILVGRLWLLDDDVIGFGSGNGDWLVVKFVIVKLLFGCNFVEVIVFRYIMFGSLDSNVWRFDMEGWNVGGMDWGVEFWGFVCFVFRVFGRDGYFGWFGLKLLFVYVYGFVFEGCFVLVVLLCYGFWGVRNCVLFIWFFGIGSVFLYFGMFYWLWWYLLLEYIVDDNLLVCFLFFFVVVDVGCEGINRLGMVCNGLNFCCMYKMKIRFFMICFSL